MAEATRRSALKGLLGASAAGAALAATGAQAQAPAAAPARPAGPAPREWIDPRTGHRVRRISPDGGGGKLYFYKNSFTPQGDVMVISSPEGVSAVDLKTFNVTPLVRNPDADLMFTGRRTRNVYYSVSDPGEGQPMDRPRTVYAVDVDTRKTRKICRIPNGQFNSINADETLLLGFVAYGSKPLQPGVADPRNRRFDQAEYSAVGPDGKPLNFAKAKGVRMLQRWAARYPMEIFVVDIATGQRRVIHSTNEWVGHTQFSPTDPQQIMFCHEGPWHRVNRVWLMRADGSDLKPIHTRTMNFEIWGHEFFSPDGKWVWYDLQTPRGQVFWVAGYEIATGRRLYRRVEQNDWSVHYNISPDQKVFAGDGGDADMVAHAPDGKWIVLFRPETIVDADLESYRDELITVEYLRSERLVDMSAHDYRLEPNVVFTPDGKWVVFVSNMHGANHVYAVEVAKAA